MKELKVLENELVPVYETSTGEKVVYGSELYESLGSKRQYTDWISQRLEDCEATENEDFDSFSQKCEKGGRPKTEYIIKLDTAKEMAMLERNEKGKQVRRYFIKVEKKYKEQKNTPEVQMAYGLLAAKELIEQKDKQIERMRPKEIFADAVATSKESILIGNLAKLIKQNGVDIGQNRLFDWMYDNGYLIKSGERRRMPTQKSMDMKLFEVKERTIDNPDGSVRLTRTTKVTGKGQQYFINKFLGKTDKTA